MSDGPLEQLCSGQVRRMLQREKRSLIKVKEMKIRIQSFVRVCLPALTIASMLLAPAGAATLPSGSAVYSAALNAMRAQALPPRIDYQLSVSNSGMQMTLSCAAKPPYQFESGIIETTGAGARPPRMWNVKFVTSSGFGHATLESKKPFTFNCTPYPLGPVMHAFVHFAPTTAAPSASVAPAGPLDLMKAIVTVRAFYSRSYRIANEGIVVFSGHPSYHLQFTARDGNESKHPITDMYVDTATHLVRAVVLGGGQRGFFEGGGGFGRFTFGRVGAYWLVKNIYVEGSGHFLFLHGGGSIDMTLHHFSFPNVPAVTLAPSPQP